MNDVFLNSVVAHVPESQMPIETLRDELGLTAGDATAFKSLYGLASVARSKPPGLVPLLRAPLSALAGELGWQMNAVRYVLHCHSTPYLQPEGVHCLETLKKEFGLAGALSFSLTGLNCATGVAALAVAQRLLSSENLECAVIVLLGEPAFHPAVSYIPGTSVLGEASAACAISRRKQGPRIRLVYQQTWDLTKSEGGGVFRSPYSDALVASVHAAVEQSGVRLQDVRMIFGHNVNAISWKMFAKSCPFPLDRIYLKNISRLGHCFNADPFINLVSARDQGLIESGELSLLVSAGTGMTVSVALLEHA